MKNSVLKCVACTCVVLNLYGCKKLFPPEKLTIPLTSYTGDQLRIDGYFYEDSEPNFIIYILYRNGVILGGESVLGSEIAAKENALRNGEYYSYVKENRLRWGRFIIVDHSIKFEKWYPSPEFPVYQSAGEILNDSTFHISSSRHGEDAFKAEDELYHFKKLSPKPDSTNEFTN